MTQEILQIYDKMFKKVLTLSSISVINLINGLFDADYSLDSTIVYNWTEFEDDNLKRILADTIVTINGCHSYHMEAQIERDHDIVFRVFEYGFAYALRNRERKDGAYMLHFPEPKIIYLDYTGTAPSYYDLILDFKSQDSYTYRVPVLDFQRTSIDEINRRKLVILIPFQLLRLRHLMKKERSAENKAALIHLIRHDIIGNITRNLDEGNITEDDARKLNSYTLKLYRHIYAHYDELEEVTAMTDESFMTDVDLFYKKQEELEGIIEQKQEKIARQDSLIEEKNSEIAEKDSAIAEKDSLIAEKDRALALSLVNSVNKAMDKLGYSLEEACEFAECTVVEYNAAKARIQ